jgi:hypothetical protein
MNRLCYYFVRWIERLWPESPAHIFKIIWRKRYGNHPLGPVS